MGLCAGIDITFRTSLPSIMDAIDILLDAGWRVDSFRAPTIAYLPLGDDDHFAWQFEPLSHWPQTIAIIEEKQRRSERIGVKLTFEETEGDFLFSADRLSLLIAINNVERKRLADCEKYTDYSWYLQRIVCPVSRELGLIESFECEDFV